MDIVTICLFDWNTFLRSIYCFFSYFLRSLQRLRDQMHCSSSLSRRLLNMAKMVLNPWNVELEPKWHFFTVRETVQAHLKLQVEAISQRLIKKLLCIIAILKLRPCLFFHQETDLTLCRGICCSGLKNHKHCWPTAILYKKQLHGYTFSLVVHIR